MRFALAVLSVGLIHFFASFMVAFMAGTQGGIWRIISKVLTFPSSLLPDNFAPSNPWLRWGLWILTSLAWGWGICALIRYLFAAARPGN